jgi:GDPmannose 4,6-dehydratase
LSFEQPIEATESILNSVINILEAIKFINKDIRFYNAGSSECFGDTGNLYANELTAMNPKSPYAIAKAAATWQVSLYREAYGLKASTGILFNHESPLRSSRFVTKKIISTVCRIAEGSKEILELGNIDIRRDWGWAPEYVEVMWRILNEENQRDYVIATGKSLSIREFIKIAFNHVNLDWSSHVKINSELVRPYDPQQINGSPAMAKKYLLWEAKIKGKELVEKLVECEMLKLNK